MHGFDADDGYSAHRAGNIASDGTSRDEYDVLGRKKSVFSSIPTNSSLHVLICCISRPKTPRTPMSWDPKDDILLKQLKEEQRLGWKEIATHCQSTSSTYHLCRSP